MDSFNRKLGCRLAVAVVLAVAGCGSSVKPDYGKLDLVNVSGRVTLDGQPLPQALVVFESPDATFSFGKTDDSGNYKLMLNSEKSGVIPGPKVVRIRTSGGLGDESEATAEPDGNERAAPAASNQEKVPPCYNAQSKLQATVDDSSRQFDFELKSDCSVTAAS